MEKMKNWKWVIRKIFTFPQWLYINLLYLKMKLSLNHLGKDCRVDKGVIFNHPKQIYIGDNCLVLHGALLYGRSNAKIGLYLEKEVTIREYAYVDAHWGFISIGEGSWLGPHSLIYGNGGLRIGKNVLIAGLTTIAPHNHGFDRIDIPIKFQPETQKGIVIEDDVWIGANCVITDGVTISKGSVIGAGSVVTKDIPPYSIAVGTPAVVIKSRQ